MHEDITVPTDLGGGYRIRPLTPADSWIVHDWTRLPYARFWAMREASADEIHEIYSWLWRSETHHAYLVTQERAPAAVFQTYQPAADEVSDHYDVEPDDLGVHLMLAPRKGTEGQRAESRHTALLVPRLLAAITEATGARRLVAEPDAGNSAALARLQASGFALGDVVHLRHANKDAQLAFGVIRDIRTALARDGLLPDDV